MCSIITFTKDMYSTDLTDHLMSDMASNPDGFSVILVDINGQVLVDLHSMDAYAVIGLLEWAAYHRAFVHCRLSTQGQITIRNTHGFHMNGIYYQHNGILSDPISKRFAVDSMLIGAKISEGSLHTTLTWLKSQSYANCFFIDTNIKQYFVTRNSVGSLFTDGRGNYSTNAYDTICQPVIPYSEHAYSFDFIAPIADTNLKPYVSRLDALDRIEEEEFEEEEFEEEFLNDRYDRWDYNNVNSLVNLEDRKYRKKQRKVG